MRRLFAVGLALLAVTAPAAASENQHRIRAGETLSAIAARYGVSVADVAAANKIRDVNFVVEGTVLTIPGREGVYVVAEGDSLGAVARRFQTSVDDLARRNGIANPNLVIVGQRLTVPANASPTPVDLDDHSQASPSVPAPPPARRADVGAAIERWAEANGIDPNLAKGLAWHESGWQQDVVSSVGAIGVMQLMPSATEHIRTNLIGVPHLDSYSMEDNVRMGVRYLRQLLVNFGGDERLAVASYYQGERAVRRVGLYPETEQFVANVLANRDMFASG